MGIQKIKKDINELNNENKPQNKKIKKIIIILAAVLLLGVVIAISTIIYINAGYRVIKGSFDYSIRCNIRTYEFVTSSNSIDIFQIKEQYRDKESSDSYIYVWTYDEDQNLEETLKIINDYDKTDLQFMNTSIGSKDYPAIFVSIKNDKGDYQYVYFLNYEGNHIGIQTSSDKKHTSEIEEMLSSFTILE